MATRRAYDVDIPWDDPFDKRPEKRTATRCTTHFRVTITAKVEGRRTLLIGPGIVQTISADGAFLVTKHRLKKGQMIRLDILTDFCPDHLGFPAAFIGSCEVTRVMPGSGDRSSIAIRFGERFRQHMDFVVFLDYLDSVSSLMSA